MFADIRGWVQEEGKNHGWRCSAQVFSLQSRWWSIFSSCTNSLPEGNDTGPKDSLNCQFHHFIKTVFYKNTLIDAVTQRMHRKQEHDSAPFLKETTGLPGRPLFKLRSSGSSANFRGKLWIFFSKFHCSGSILHVSCQLEWISKTFQ